jgi:hypothetical protein
LILRLKIVTSLTSCDVYKEEEKKRKKKVTKNNRIRQRRQKDKKAAKLPQKLTSPLISGRRLG